MKKHGIMVLALIVAASFAFTACDLAGILSPTVKVIDGKTGSGMAGVTITMTLIGSDKKDAAATYSTTTGSDGVATFSSSANVPSGKYAVTAAKTGNFAFTTVTADVSGWNQTLPPIYGVAAANDTDVSVILTWTAGTDVDGYLSYEASLDSGGNGGYVVTPATTGAYDGFSGNTRSFVYWNAKNAGKFGSLDVDNKSGPGPETITMSMSKISATSTGTTFTAAAGMKDSLSSFLTAGQTYQLLGVGEYYVDGYTKTLSTASTATNSNVKVFLTQKDKIVGVYSLPEYVGLQTVSIFRTLIFVNTVSDVITMVFYPDLRTFSSAATIKGLGDFGPFAVTGPRGK